MVAKDSRTHSGVSRRSLIPQALAVVLKNDFLDYYNEGAMDLVTYVIWI